MSNQELESLRNISRRSMFLSLLGFIIILGSLGFSALTIFDLSEKYAKLRKSSETLTVDIARKQARIDQLNSTLTELERTNSPEGIKVFSNEVLVPNAFDEENRQLYDISIWLQVPLTLKGQIREVDYYFENSTMRLKHRKSNIYENGYSVSYRGWGVLNDVLVTLTLKTGESYRIHYDQWQRKQSSLEIIPKQ